MRKPRASQRLQRNARRGSATTAYTIPAAHSSPATDSGKPPNTTASAAATGSALCANRTVLLLRWVLSRAAQAAHTVDDAVAVRVTDGLDQVAPFVAVAA